jgi:hypothetical protein
VSFKCKVAKSIIGYRYPRRKEDALVLAKESQVRQCGPEIKLIRQALKTKDEMEKEDRSAQEAVRFVVLWRFIPETSRIVATGNTRCFGRSAGFDETHDGLCTIVFAH